MTAALLGCSDPEVPTPDTSNQTSAPFTAKFTFANATVDGGSLDLYVNGIKVGASSTPGVGNNGYAEIGIPSSGFAGTATANTSIRAKATSGSIGGKLGTNDLIYRSANNGTNNFVAITGMTYTVFAMDSINRPIPLRKMKWVASGSNKIQVADVTYFNPHTKEQISLSKRDSIIAGTAVPTPVANEAANLLTIGLVPLGITDPGGLRFYVVQDAFLSATALPPATTTDAGIRFVNLVANANNISAPPTSNGAQGGKAVWARLTPVTTGSTISLATQTTHVANQGNFNPTVGSRTVTTTPPAVPAANFTVRSIAIAGVPNQYNLEVSLDNFSTIAYTSPAPLTFTPGKHYTVFVRGVGGGVGPKAISHGVIEHQ